MKRLRFYFGAGFMMCVLHLFAQNSLLINKEGKADSLKALSQSEFLDYLHRGGDINEVLQTYNDGSKLTVFEMIAHDFGYNCNSDDNEFIYQIVTTAGKPIENPLFFMNDPCPEKVKDILEYYLFLARYNHAVTEKDFKRVWETYFNRFWYADINYRDTYGKTLLQVACELNYQESVIGLLNKNADPSPADAVGMTALMHACIADNLRIIELLLAKGADTRTRDDFGTTAVGYCISDSAIKMVEKVFNYQEKEYGYPLLTLQKGTHSKKINTKKQMYFEFFTDIAGDTLKSGTGG